VLNVRVQIQFVDIRGIIDVGNAACLQIELKPALLGSGRPVHAAGEIELERDVAVGIRAGLALPLNRYVKDNLTAVPSVPVPTASNSNEALPLAVPSAALPTPMSIVRVVPFAVWVPLPEAAPALVHHS